MSDTIVNRNLELACSVGSYDNALEALEEGANVNFHSGAPLFSAILGRNREILNLLLDRGADASFFLSKKLLKQHLSREELIETLIACAPCNPKDVKIDEIREVDSAIRSTGVEFLVSELDWDDATRFRDSLNAIGADSSHRCVSEFLQWAKSESRESDDGLSGFLRAHGDALVEYRSRYLESGEDLIALANEFINANDSEGE